MNSIEFMDHLKKLKDAFEPEKQSEAECKPILYRGDDFALSARPSEDGENVLIQVWFIEHDRAALFANTFGCALAGMSNNPEAFYDCLSIELVSPFPSSYINSCLIGMRYCVSILF